MKKASIALVLTLLCGSLFALPWQQTVDLNQADEKTLETLPGIGPALARRIVDHREKNGPFQKIEDLMNVPGIGAKKFEALEKHLSLSQPSSAGARKTKPSRQPHFGK